MRRRLVTILGVLFGPWLLYLVLGNLVLMTPLLTRWINRNPSRYLISYRHALTWFPGYIWVDDFRLSFQAPRIAFELIIDRSTARIVLGDVLHKRLRLTHVRSSGVSYQMYSKVDPAKPNLAQLAAWPRIEGSNPLKLEPDGIPKTKEQVAKLWTVQLDDVETTFREVWIFEYRWRGKGRAKGGFALKPMSSLIVGPCESEMEPGQLTVGDELVSNDFQSDFSTFVTPVEIDMQHKLQMLRGLQVQGSAGGTLRSLAFTQLYGLESHGNGSLHLDVALKNGIFGEGTAAAVTLPDAHSRLKSGGGFDGELAVKAWVNDGQALLHAAAGGAAHVPLPRDEVVSATVPEALADATLTTTDMTQRWRLAWFDARTPKLQVDDVKPALEAFKHKLPPFVPSLFGDHPLIAHGLSGRGSPADFQVSIGDARIRETQLEGEVELKGNRPTGAFMLKVATLPVGVSIRDGKLGIRFFAKGRWLEEQLDALPSAQGRRRAEVR